MATCRSSKCGTSRPFGLFAIFGLAHWLFGPEPLAYQLVATLSAVTGAWLVYRLATFWSTGFRRPSPARST